MSDTQELARAVDEIAAQYYVSSWGYDQTNVDWYRVTRRTRSSVWLQPWTSVSVAQGQGSDRVLPGDGPALVRVNRFEPGSPEVEACRVCRAFTDGYYGASSMTYVDSRCPDHGPDYVPAPARRHAVRADSEYVRVGHQYARPWTGVPAYETAVGWGH